MSCAQLKVDESFDISPFWDPARPMRGAQPGPAEGPSPAQARPKPGPGQISGNLEPGNLEIWDPTKIQKIKALKVKIRVVQNVRKVWISRKIPPGPIWGHFRPIFQWIGKMPKSVCFCIFSLVGQWTLFTRFGLHSLPTERFSQFRPAVKLCLTFHRQSKPRGNQAESWKLPLRACKVQSWRVQPNG